MLVLNIHEEGMTVSILGCGWYGTSLAKLLIEKGITVKGSTTSIEKFDVLAANHIIPYLININVENETYNSIFFQCDILIVCISPQFKQGHGAEYPFKI